MDIKEIAITVLGRSVRRNEFAMDAKKDLNPLLNPKCIAIVGASEKFSAGSSVIENLWTLGYEGKIIPINPEYSTVLGLPCYPSLLDVPTEEKIECAAILLGYKQIIPVLEQAAKREVHGAWALASGFAEAGEEGVRLQRQLRKLCLDNGIMFCGPNCVGYANLISRAGTFSAPLSPTLRRGNVGVVAQSGAVVLALANSNRGVGFSLLISSGNEAVLDTTDYLGYLVNDGETEVILGFLETIRRPKAFARACERAAELNKPIIVVKIGRSELAQKSAMTHTGALTGSDRIVDVFFKKLGVIRVDDIDQMLETAEAFVHCKDRLPKSSRVGMITVSGGEVGLIEDLIERYSISFPPLSRVARQELGKRLPLFTPVGNPLDAWGRGDLTETYPACLEVLAREPEVDLIAVSQDSPAGMADKQVKQFADVAKAAVRVAGGGKPVIVFSHVSGGFDPTIKAILDGGNIPLLQGTRESLLAVHSLVDYGRFQIKRKVKSNDTGKSPSNLRDIIEKLSGKRRVLPYKESIEIIKAYGIQVVQGIIAESVEEALKGAERIGYPVALKGQSCQIPHKTEAGLVMLNVRDERELRRTFEEITRQIYEYDPKAILDGILIQEMVSEEAIEVIVGITIDLSFGPVIIVGLGGILAELLKDTSLRLSPVTLEDAHSMISELKGKILLEGFRGKIKTDIDALAEVLVQVSRMSIDLKETSLSLDLNPLMVLPGHRGTRVVDVLMEVGG